MMGMALWHIDAEFSELRENISFKDIGNGVLIKSAYSLISTGTEKLIACGEVDNSFLPFMSVPYMAGRFSLPIKYGYSLVGKRTDTGQFIHAMHPHQSHCKIAEKDMAVIPEQLSPLKAALISNMETVINAIWDADIQGGEKVLIAGFGNIGCLLAETLTHYGVSEIHILEKEEWKKEIISSFGFSTDVDIDANYDLAFDTTASKTGLQFCLDAVRSEGTVINLSWYGNRTIELSLGGSFHYGRKKIISSQVSVIPEKMKNSWDFKSRKKLVMDLLSQHPYEKYITHIIPFKETPDFFQRLRKGQQEKGLIWSIKYE